MKGTGHIVTMGEVRNVFKILIRKRPLGRPMHRGQNNVRIYLKEIGVSTRNWIDSTQDMDDWRSPVDTALKPRVT